MVLRAGSLMTLDNLSTPDNFLWSYLLLRLLRVLLPISYFRFLKLAVHLKAKMVWYSVLDQKRIMALALSLQNLILIHH